MARISTYAQDTTVSSQDSLIGTDGNNQNSTKIFPVDALGAYLDENFRNDIGNLIPPGGVPVVDDDGQVIPGPIDSDLREVQVGGGAGQIELTENYFLRRNRNAVELEVAIPDSYTYDISSLSNKVFTATLGRNPLLPTTIKTIGGYLGVRRVEGTNGFFRLVTAIQPLSVGLVTDATSVAIEDFSVESVNVRTLVGITGDSVRHIPTNGIITEIEGGEYTNGTLTLDAEAGAVLNTFIHDADTTDEPLITRSVNVFVGSLADGSSTWVLPLGVDGESLQIANLSGNSIILNANRIEDRVMGVGVVPPGLVPRLILDPDNATFTLVYVDKINPITMETFGWTIIGAG